jgi:membrane protease subunit HflC
MKMNSIFPIFGLILLIVVGVVLRASIYTLDQAEQAVIVQLGAPVGDPVTKPGLHFKLPFIQEVRRFDKRVISWDGDPNQIPTRGEQFISVDTTARWRISDPLVFMQRVQNERGATMRLNDILDSVVRDKISATDLVEIVRSKDWKISEADLARVQLSGEDDEEILLQEVKTGRQELVKSIFTQAASQMPEMGIELIDIRIKRIDYVEAVEQRVFDRMIAERQRIAEQFRSEGEGRAAEIDGDTKRKLSEIQSEANRKAEIIRGQADAEASSIYSQSFGADPEFYAFLRTLESYPKTVHNSSTLILGTDSEYFRYLRNVSVQKVMDQ